jgi:hypothetical protein
MERQARNNVNNRDIRAFTSHGQTWRPQKGTDVSLIYSYASESFSSRVINLGPQVQLTIKYLDRYYSSSSILRLLPFDQRAASEL